MISWIYAFWYKQGDCIDVLDVELWRSDEKLHNVRRESDAKLGENLRANKHSRKQICGLRKEVKRILDKFHVEVSFLWYRWKDIHKIDEPTD